MRPLLLTGLLLVAGAACARSAAAPRADAAEPPAEPGRAVRGEYIVTVAPGTTARSLEASLADLAPRQVRPLGADRYVVTFGDDPGLTRLQFRVGSGQILAVQPNYVYRKSR